jgi:uncharacterized membrane protein YbjE (DUF340 family)
VGYLPCKFANIPWHSYKYTLTALRVVVGFDLNDWQYALLWRVVRAVRAAFVIGSWLHLCCKMGLGRRAKDLAENLLLFAGRFR